MSGPAGQSLGLDEQGLAGPSSDSSPPGVNDSDSVRIDILSEKPALAAHSGITEPPPLQESVNSKPIGGHRNARKQAAKVTPTTIDQNTVFWKAYNDAGDLEDKDFVKSAGSDLDALLIFAGLFSATNTAFIIESYKSLRLDPVDKTNELLQSLLSVTQNLQAPNNATPFAASPRDIRINACFFTSLCCSLSAAFGAVLAKQWLTQYDQDSGGTLKEPANRGRERQRKYKGRDKWHLEDVIITLPTLLQFSLFFFFVGLVDFLWPLNHIVTSIALGFTLATFLFYVITIAISVVNTSAPFQTRLSRLLRRLWPLNLEAILPEDIRNANIECLLYLLDRMTKLRDVLLADAFTSLSGDLGAHAGTVIASLVDFHLKPIRGLSWCIPTLYGDDRFPLLKILTVLVKQWAILKYPAIQTPLYGSLDTAALLKDIPGELQRAFLAEPSDTESCQCIVDILLTLHPNGLSAPYSRDADTGMWQVDWLKKDVTKYLADADPAVQQNTLAVVALAVRDCSERQEAWDIVKAAKKENPTLSRSIHSMVWREISGVKSGEVLDNQDSLHLLAWMLVSDDTEELSGALETLPDGAGSVAAAQPLISKLVIIIVHRLKPTFDGWWHLPGLRDPGWKSLLAALHVIIVRWKYLETDLNTNAPSFRLLHPLICSLRVELSKVFLAEPEDAEVVRKITDICEHLPNLTSGDTDEICTAAALELSADISTLLERGQANATILQHCFSFHRANAVFLRASTNFQDIHLTPVTSRAISGHLRSTMWVKDKADLEISWIATLRVQFVPVFFPDELRSLKFVKYLHLWFQHYIEPGIPYHLTTYNEVQQAQQAWAYLLSLRRMFSRAEASGWAEELRGELMEHKHQLHLQSLLDGADRRSFSTWVPLALHLRLNLRPDDISCMKGEAASYVGDAFVSGKLSLSQILQNITDHARGFQAGDTSEENWCNNISAQVTRDMGRMVIHLSFNKIQAVGDPSSFLPLEWLATLDYASQIPTQADGLSGVVVSVQALVNGAAETIVEHYLRPWLDNWWRFPGFHGSRWRPLMKATLMALHLVIVKWKYLNTGLSPGATSLRRFISSLRAGLWEVFLANPERPEVIEMTRDICANLPNLVSASDNSISRAAMRKVCKDIVAQFDNDEAEPTLLEHCFAMLCSNTDALITFANFHMIRLVPGTSRAIPNHLRSTMWIEDVPDLEDFWRATFRVQLLPVFFPNELHTLKFAKYLHLWLQRYYQQTRHNGMRQAEMHWTYFLSLQRMLSTEEAPIFAKEFKELGHMRLLLEIIEAFKYEGLDTRGPFALYLLLRLWSHETSDEAVDISKGIVNCLVFMKLSLTGISSDIRTHAQASRMGDAPDDEWAEEILSQVREDMGQMVRWVHSYFETAIRSGLPGSGDWYLGLKGYKDWCSEMDGELKSDEYGRLAEGLYKLLQ